jgi:hypothetical protein
MAKEILLLDNQPNDTLRAAFLFKVPTVTRLTATTTGTGLPVDPPVDPVPTEQPIKATSAVSYSTSGAPLRWLRPSEIDPILVSVLAADELAAIIDGQVAYSIYILQLQLPADDWNTGMKLGLGPGYAELQLAFDQQEAQFRAAYNKRDKYLGKRLNAV